MLVIRATNVNDALTQGVQLVQDYGVDISPRGARTLEVPEPVCTVYQKPLQRVLFSSVRDANPFFHHMEALWILAGRKDVAFLTKFNKRMAEFSDDGKVFHAAYGHRLRVGADPRIYQDQFKEVIRLFRKDINTRRAVLQIWCNYMDLNVESKDLPCNDLVFLKVRNGKLNISVANRSNDVIWGCYGANAVQFSFIQEYLAAMLGVEVGEYRQVSDSYHVYPDNPLWDKLVEDIDPFDGYQVFGFNTYPLVSDPEVFDHELKIWFDNPSNAGIRYNNLYFQGVAVPMYVCWQQHKCDRSGLSMVNHICADDWRFACRKWLERREK